MAPGHRAVYLGLVMTERASGTSPWQGSSRCCGHGARRWPSLDGRVRLRLRPRDHLEPNIEGRNSLRVPTLRSLLGTGRPLTNGASFAIDLTAGFDPRRFHLTGLAFHLVAVVFAFAFLRRIGGRRRPSPARRDRARSVTAAFALNPVQMDGAAYVSQRAEVLSALYLATLILLGIAALRWRSRRASPPGPPACAGTSPWGEGHRTRASPVPSSSTRSCSAPRAAAAAPPSCAGACARSGRAPHRGVVAWSAALQFASFEATPSAGVGQSAYTFPWWCIPDPELRVQWSYLR